MRTVIRVSCALLVAIGAAGATIAAQAKTPAWAPQVDKVFSQWDRRDSPGCALGVFENGAIAYERGYGMADIEHDVPIAPDSVFYVGSLSKQFTAMAAAFAVQQGKLSPDDSIRKYLPELPDYATAIKVRHLIHHTSGLRDYNTLLSIAGRRGDEAYDNPTVLRMTARQRSLNFQPGAEYLYSYLFNGSGHPGRHWRSVVPRVLLAVRRRSGPVGSRLPLRRAEKRSLRERPYDAGAAWGLPGPGEPTGRRTAWPLR